MRNVLKTAFALALVGWAFFGVHSCKPEKMKEGMVWNCSEVQSDTFRLSRIGTAYRLLPLQTTEQSLLGSVDKLWSRDSLLYVMDRDLAAKIFVFHAETGAFLTKFGERGNGPGEYRQLYDCAMDEVGNRIHLLCDKNRLITYSGDGRLLEKRELPFLAVDMEYSDGIFLFVCETSATHNLVITDEHLQVLHEYFPHSDYRPGNMRRVLHPLQKTDAGVLYRRFLDDRIYRIDRQGGVSVQYTIDFGADKLDFSKAKSLSEEELDREMAASRCHIKYFVESSRYAFMVFFDREKPFASIFDKKEGMAYTYLYERMKDDSLNTMFPLLEYVGQGGKSWMAVCEEAVVRGLIETGELPVGDGSTDILNPVLYRIASEPLD